MSTRSGLWFVLQCSTILTACSGGSAEVCTRDGDCASGFCKADGTCGPADVDGGTDTMIPDGSTLLCTPDHDGTIAANEIPLAAGRMANFRISTSATFATAGQASGSGSRA